MVSKEIPKGWDIDSTRFYGPNVVSCYISTRIQQATLIRAYLSLATMDRLPDLEEAFNHFFGSDTIVMGTYLNRNSG